MLTKLINPNVSEEDTRQFVKSINDVNGLVKYVGQVAEGKMTGYDFPGLSFRYWNNSETWTGIIIKPSKIGSFQDILEVIPDHANITYLENITKNKELIHNLFSTPVRYATKSLHLSWREKGVRGERKIHYTRKNPSFKDGLTITVPKYQTDNVISSLEDLGIKTVIDAEYPTDLVVLRDTGSPKEIIDDTKKLFDKLYKEDAISIPPIHLIQSYSDLKPVSPIKTKYYIEAVKAIENAGENANFHAYWTKDYNRFIVKARPYGSKEIIIISPLNDMKETLTDLFIV